MKIERLLGIVVYIDFDIKNIVIKGEETDLTRVLALKNNSFDKYAEKSVIQYNDYYFKRKYQL